MPASPSAPIPATAASQANALARAGRRLDERARSPAASTYERLMAYVAEFEAQLDPDQEVGGRMVSFGSVVQFHILNVGYWDPDIITFDGVDETGNKLKLIQNVSQLNVLLVSMRKLKAEEAPRRIGFEIRSSDERPDEADRQAKG